jgi:nucleotide-binding universal stress UspA family protein
MTNGIIKVAADGSKGSRRALEWALREAEIRGCGVEIVCAYEAATGQDKHTARVAAERRVHATLDAIVAGRVDLPLVSWHVVEGNPVDVLVRESERSELLVMGSHDVTGMLHAASASPDDLVSRLASCPVVIVPTSSPSPDESTAVIRATLSKAAPVDLS